MPAFITAYKLNIEGLASNIIYMLQGERLIQIIHNRVIPMICSKTYVIDKINTRSIALAMLKHMI
jgi:hypothetical protein